MNPFDAILFDFDGVLIDSEPLHCACWAEVLKPLGVRLEWDFYSRHCIGIDDREMLRMMATQADPPRDWNQLWAQYPAKRDLFRERTLKAPPFDAALGRAARRITWRLQNGGGDIERALRNRAPLASGRACGIISKPWSAAGKRAASSHRLILIYWRRAS